MFKHWKKIIIGMGIGGVITISVTLPLGASGITPIDFNGKTISYPFTDDNENEDLLIYTDKEFYGGFDYVPVHFAIKNNSTKDQNVIIQFLTEKSETAEFWELQANVTKQRVRANYGLKNTVCTDLKVTTTFDESRSLYECDEKILYCDSVVDNTCVENNAFLSTSTEHYSIDQWAKIDGVAVESIVPQKRISPSFKANSQTTYSIPSGETRYFYAQLNNLDFRTNGKFYILANGDEGAKGLLDPWYDSNFQYCRKLTINDGGTVGGVATTTTLGFPILATTTLADLKATSSAGKIEKLDSNNNKPFDLIFTSGTDCNSDGGSLLDFEIEAYSSTTGALTAWFKATDISSTTEKYVLMYYGNDSATDQSDAAGVWSSQNEGGVWHLSETTGTHLDSTSNNNDSTEVDVFAQGTTGYIAGADDFELDSNDNVSIAGSASLSPAGDFTLSAWIRKETNPSSSQSILSIPNKGIYFGSRNDDLYIGIATSGSYDECISTSPTFSTAVWYYVTARFNDSSKGMTLYINGNAVSQTTSFGNGCTQVGTPADLGDAGIGFTHEGAGSEYFDGLVDEARFYNRLLDPMDILTNYNMQVANANFLSFGSEETESGGGATVSPDYKRKLFIQ